MPTKSAASPEPLSPVKRTTLEAIHIVLEELKSGKTYSIAELSRATGLERPTVDHAVEIILEVGKYGKVIYQTGSRQKYIRMDQ